MKPTINSLIRVPLHSGGISRFGTCGCDGGVAFFQPFVAARIHSADRRMKGILLDENLPRGIVLPMYITIYHVNDIGPSLTDTQVWQYARERDWLIVTKDSDFLHRALVSEPPPWVAHLRLGNLRLRQFCEAMQTRWPTIEAAFPSGKVVSIYPERLEVIS